MQITSMGKVGRGREREGGVVEIPTLEKGRKRRNKEHAIRTFCFLSDQTSYTMMC